MLNINLDAWKKQLDGKIAISTHDNNKTLEKAAELLKNRIMEYTPVGNPALWHYPAHKNYTPGYLRSNWKLSTKDNVFIISNDAPYALRVEQGWSSQAPYGMMARGALDFPELLKKAKQNQ